MMFTTLLVLTLCVKVIFAYEVFIEHKVACFSNQLQTTSCCSLEYIASEFGSVSNLTIHLSGKINVSQLILFKNVSLLSFIGSSKEKTKISCSSPNSSDSNNFGLRFVNVSFLKISNVVIENCEAEHFFVSGFAIKASVAIVNCSNIELDNVQMLKSNATAMFIENTSGNVSLINVSVLNHGSKRKIEPATSYAKGIFIYSNSSVTKTNYVIKNSQFVNISTCEYESFDVQNVKDVNSWLGYGLGGGLSIVFDGNSLHNNVTVINCTFKENFAPWGAGMYIGFEKNASFNSVYIVSTLFEKCSARFAGGGLGICLVKRTYTGNTVYVHNTTFLSNYYALYGAGTYICALYGYNIRSTKPIFAKFSNCSWIENIGRYSPAVDIAPTQFDQQQSGVLPLPIFENCKFLKNQNVIWRKGKRTHFISSGVFVVTKFTVIFSGSICFDSNFYTALSLNSATIALQENAYIHFVNNTGFRGGAILLNGFSFIAINDNCKVNFLNNRATEYGGAIFHYPIEQREFFAGRVCFLEYNRSSKSPIDKRNISFVFSGNTASIQGSAIYSTSFFPCYYSYHGNIHGHKVYDFFKEIGNFTFSSINISLSLGTTETSIKSTNQVLSVFPGQRLSLPITVQDELHQPVRLEFFVEVKKSFDSKFCINSAYTMNRTVIIYGRPKDNGTIVISSQHVYRGIQHEMSVTLLPCPPGYYHDISKLSCECSYRHQSKFYLGIKKCYDQNFTAVIQKGYWAGYHRKRDKLYTAQCPFQFCILNTKTEMQHSLPNSSQALNLFMCGPTRRGVLCGKCEDGFSTFYHSRAFSCGSSQLCSYGIILFIISEILPVLIFFTVVIIFDVSFSSGARNGFIFFSQMVMILPSEFITISSGHFHEYLTISYTWIYGIFNIDFFSAESLSFCLFSGATVMDALAFKYITSVLALALVLLLTIGINYCNCCDKLCVALKKTITKKDSVLNGLSAFLVISYAECVRVSFFILRWKVLKGEGGAFGPYVAFYGGINYFEGRHLFYSIIAILTFGTIGLLPPLLLFIYPSTLKLLQLCKLNEHRFVLGILKATRINALMPVFDVFQGCFKDSCRCFAGLYFFYRAALLVPYSFSENLTECAVLTELVLAFIIGIHSTFHPYKKNAYNAIDSLLLCNLAIINGISIFLKLKMSETQESFGKNFTLKMVLYIQILFIYLPLFILSLYIVKNYCTRKASTTDQSTTMNDEVDLLEYLEYHNESTENDNMNH